MRKVIYREAKKNTWESKKNEKAVQASSLSVFEKIQEQYGDLSFVHETVIEKSEINKKLNAFWEGFGTTLYSKKEIGSAKRDKEANIRPDGGAIILLGVNGERFLVGAFESKKQGTNDKRAKRGLKPQGIGNAIERGAKNYLEICNYVISEDITPHAMFMTGCDFRKPHMKDRATGMTLGSPLNAIYTQDVKGKKRSTIYVDSKKPEMKRVMLSICETSVEYYRHKYPEAFIGLAIPRQLKFDLITNLEKV